MRQPFTTSLSTGSRDAFIPSRLSGAWLVLYSVKTTESYWQYWSDSDVQELLATADECGRTIETES